VRADLIPRIDAVAKALKRQHRTQKQEFITALFEERIEALEEELGISQQESEAA
jgi:hypothetical protein